MDWYFTNANAQLTVYYMLSKNKINNNSIKLPKCTKWCDQYAQGIAYSNTSAKREESGKRTCKHFLQEKSSKVPWVIYSLFYLC